MAHSNWIGFVFGLLRTRSEKARWKLSHSRRNQLLCVERLIRTNCATHSTIWKCSFAVCWTIRSFCRGNSAVYTQSEHFRRNYLVYQPSEEVKSIKLLAGVGWAMNGFSVILGSVFEAWPRQRLLSPLEHDTNLAAKGSRLDKGKVCWSLLRAAVTSLGWHLIFGNRRRRRYDRGEEKKF